MRTTLARISIVVSLLLNATLFSQDIKGGDIRFTQSGSNQYSATIKLYQKTSVMINRPYLLISWGNNMGDSAHLYSTGPIAPDLTETIYTTATHTFPGAGNYTLSVADSFWVNYLINAPNSANEALYLNAHIVVSPLAGTENSSVFLNYPAPVANANGVISYYAAASDADGDSLSYQLIPPTASYSLPGNTSIDPVTGDFTMMPMSIGSYMIGIKVTEWRHISTSVIQVGDMMRCMVIDVDSLTSVHEIPNGEMQVKAFPNPASDQLILNFGKEIPDGELVITDALGREVSVRNLYGERRVELSVANLADGVYYCRLLENGEFSMAGKIAVKK